MSLNSASSAALSTARKTKKKVSAGRFTRNAMASSGPVASRSPSRRKRSSGGGGGAKIDLRAEDLQSRNLSAPDFTCDDEILVTYDDGPTDDVHRRRGRRGEEEQREEEQEEEEEEQQEEEEEQPAGLGGRILGIFGAGPASAPAAAAPAAADADHAPPPPPPVDDDDYDADRLLLVNERDGGGSSRHQRQGGAGSAVVGPAERSAAVPSSSSSFHRPRPAEVTPRSRIPIVVHDGIEEGEEEENANDDAFEEEEEYGDRQSLLLADAYDNPGAAAFAGDYRDNVVGQRRTMPPPNFPPTPPRTTRRRRRHGGTSKQQDEGSSSSCTDVLGFLLASAALVAVSYGAYTLFRAHRSHVISSVGGGQDSGGTSTGPASGSGTSSQDDLDLAAVFASPRFKSIRRSIVLHSVSDPDTLLPRYPPSPQFLAVRWLAEFDPLRLDPIDDTGGGDGGGGDGSNVASASSELMTRYVMAVLWFGSHKKAAAEAEGGGDGGGAAVRADGFVPWSNETNWLSGTSVCAWAGVTCREVGTDTDTDSETGDGDGGDDTTTKNRPRRMAVVKLNYDLNNMGGTLPLSELAALTTVETMTFHNNDLTGTLDALGRMRRLATLDLAYNRIGGTMPASISDCTDLTSVDLEGNVLTGIIPGGSMVHLHSLVTLKLRNNQLVGPIPPELGQLPRLETLVLGENSLTGSLPSLPTSLRSIVLDKNSLTGTLPKSYLTSSKTENLQLSLNRLSGPILADMDMQHLKRLGLSHNQLTGTIPSALARSLQLEGVGLEGNQFSGPLPEEIGKLVKLKQLYIHMNSVTGTIPQSVCQLRQRSLEVLMADCGGDSPKVECVCCTHCEP